MVCVDAILVPNAVSPESCAQACRETLYCAGSTYSSNNNCFFCGHGSVWSDLEQAAPKTEPKGCTYDSTLRQRVCVSCPGPLGIEPIRSFQSLRIANAMLALSATCAYIAPAKPTDVFGVNGSSIELVSNTSIVGPGTILNPIVVTGSNVTIENLTVTEAIRIGGQNATVRNVRSYTSPGAIKVVDASIGPLEIFNTIGARAVAGFGHAAAKVNLKHCVFDGTKSPIAFVLQEAYGATNQLVASRDDTCQNLPDVNLSALLNVFGREYEVRFYDDGRYDHTIDVDIFEYLMWLVIVNVIFAFNLYVLVGSELLK